MAAIEGVIADAKTMEADAINAEADAQKAYEEFGKQTNDSLDAMTRAIITKSGNKAAMESDKTETSEALDYSVSTLESLEGENQSLHLDCDYTLKLFDLRQQQRGEEVEALKQALAILGGASFNALLQGDDVTPETEEQDAIDQHVRDFNNRMEQDLPASA